MSVISRSACPQCQHHGGDRNGNNLVKFDNDTAHCFACGYHEGEAIRAAAKADSASLYLPPTQQIPGISYDTAAFFGATTDGMCTYFHTFDEQNKLLGVKVRNYVAESCGAQKHETIRYSGEAGIYGLNTLQYTDSIVLVEGESDCMFLWQAFGGMQDVLALPGASTARYIENVLDLLNSYSRIVVLTDNDSAGNKLRNDLYTALPDWLTYEAHYPKHANDARDCTVSELIECVNNAVGYSLTTCVVRGAQAHADAQRNNDVNTRMVLDTSRLSPGLTRLLAGGIHAGDFLGLLGNSGQGKSTLMYQIASHAIYNGVNTLFVTNEESVNYVSAALGQVCSVDMLGAYCTVVETDSFESLMHILTQYGKDLVLLDVLNGIAPDFMEPVPTGSYMRQLLRHVNNAGIGMLCSVHTTANNEQFKPLPLKLADAAGGRAVQRALNGVLGFTAGLPNMHANARLLTVAKKLRHRRVANPESVMLQYDVNTNTYFEYGAVQNAFTT